MSALLMIAWGIAFLIRFGQRAGAIRAAMDASVCFGALTVLGCEALSLAHAYTALWLSAYWLLLCAAALTLLRKPFIAGWRRILALRPRRMAWYAWVGGAIVAACALGTLLSALLYPPMNYDSAVYHMPRVFFWMKNASVHNYPTDVGRQLFTGPLTEFFILQLQVLCLGSDVLANLAQWFAYLGTILAVCGLAAELGAGSRGRWLAAVLTATTPLAILQASSTQSDLEAAFWCAVTAYYVAAYWRGLRAARGERLIWALCVGGAAGLALLAKLNTLPVTVTLAVAALALMMYRRAWVDLKRVVAPVLACMLLINAGFFVRNAVDLQGDFLAYDLPETNDLHPPTNDLRARAVLSVGTLAYNLANTPVPQWNWVVDGCVSRAGQWLGITMKDPAIARERYSTKNFITVQLHDTRSSPVQAVLSYATIAVLLIAALGWRKYRRFPAVMAAAVLVAYVTVSASLRFTTSAPRYLLPMVMIMLGLVPAAFGGGRARRGIACLAVPLAAYLAAGALLFNLFQPLVLQPTLARALSSDPVGFGRFNASYERMRAYSTGIKAGALEAVRARVASEFGAEEKVRIGVKDCALGVYPVLYDFRDARFDVRCIEAKYLSDHEDPAFVPDAVLTMAGEGEGPAEITVRGQRYVLAEEHPALLAAVRLYIQAQ